MTSYPIPAAMAPYNALSNAILLTTVSMGLYCFSLWAYPGK